MKRKKRVTIRDIAKACNVSAPTVSRVLNKNFDGFSLQQEKIDLIHKTCKEMGYRPNRFARSLRSQRSGFIGLSLTYDPAWNDRVGNLQNPVISGIGKLVAGASSELEKHQYNLIFLPRNEDLEEPFDEELIFPYLVDGVIYINPSERHREIEEIYSQRQNVILIGGHLPNSDVPCVDVDNYREMHKLSSHVIESGSRNILFLTFAGGHYRLVHDRYEGHMQALRDHGIAPRDDLVYNREMDESEVTGFLVGILKERPDVDGIIVSVGSFYLNEIVAALNQLGLRMPEDLRLAVFHGEPELNFFWPGITHIQISQYHIAAAAAKHLLSGIEEGQMQVESIMIPCDLVIGQSTRLETGQALAIPTCL